MATTPVRVPVETEAGVSRMASMLGTTKGELLAKAWDEYLHNHRESLADNVQEIANLLKHGTTEELSEYMVSRAGHSAALSAALIREEGGRH